MIESAVVNVGDIFTIDVSVSGAVDLQAFQFDLSYDSSKLKLISFTDSGTDFETTALVGGGFLTGLTGFTSAGLLSGTADSMSGIPSGGGLTSGTILDITFKDIALGTTPLIAANVFLNYSDQGFEVVNGQVSNPTGQGSAPEPDSLALLCIGLFCSLGFLQSHNRHTDLND